MTRDSDQRPKTKTKDERRKTSDQRLSRQALLDPWLRLTQECLRPSLGAFRVEVIPVKAGEAFDSGEKRGAVDGLCDGRGVPVQPPARGPAAGALPGVGVLRRRAQLVSLAA